MKPRALLYNKVDPLCANCNGPASKYRSFVVDDTTICNRCHESHINNLSVLLDSINGVRVNDVYTAKVWST
jgi:hypothetical protein